MAKYRHEFFVRPDGTIKALHSDDPGYEREKTPGPLKFLSNDDVLAAQAASDLLSIKATLDADGETVLSVEPIPGWQPPTRTITETAARQFFGFAVNFFAWIKDNPTADQAAGLGAAQAIMEADGETTIWNISELLTRLVVKAHEDWPGQVAAATWDAFRDAIVGLAPAQFPILKNWLQSL